MWHNGNAHDWKGKEPNGSFTINLPRNSITGNGTRDPQGYPGSIPGMGVNRYLNLYNKIFMR